MSITSSGRAIRSPGRTAWLTLGGAVTVVVLICGAIAAWTVFSPQRTEDQRQEYRQAIRKVELDSNGGDVTVNAGEAGVVAVERHLRWSSLEKPTVTESVSGDTLRITVRCPDTGLKFGLGDDCSVDYELRLPAGVAVDARTEAGTVRARDLDGDVRLTASAGEVVAENLRGPLWARADSGSITGTGLRSAQVDVSIDSGDVQLTFAGATTTVTAIASAGNVTVGLAHGRYKVQAAADTGASTVDVTQDPAARSTVTARTGAGDVLVRYA